MKQPLSILLFVGSLAVPLALTGGACGSLSSTDASTPTTASTSTVASLHTATLKVEGMTCASCKVTVKTAGRKLDGVQSVDVDVDAGQATVTYDASKVTAEEIAKKISATGYTATVQSDPDA